jgi:hypothetical protein
VPESNLGVDTETFRKDVLVRLEWSNTLSVPPRLRVLRLLDVGSRRSIAIFVAALSLACGLEVVVFR